MRAKLFEVEPGNEQPQLGAELGADDAVRQPVRLPEVVELIERDLRQTVIGSHVCDPRGAYGLSFPPVLDDQGRFIRPRHQEVPGPTGRQLYHARAAEIDEIRARDQEQGIEAGLRHRAFSMRDASPERAAGPLRTGSVCYENEAQSVPFRM